MEDPSINQESILIQYRWKVQKHERGQRRGRGVEVFRDKTTDMGLLLRTCADYLHDSWENITLYSWGYSHIGQRMHVYIFRWKETFPWPPPPGLPHAMMCRWLQPDVHWLDTGIVLIEKTHLFTWPFLFFLFASIIILYMTMLFPITHSKFVSFRKFDGDRVLLLFFLNSAWLYNFGKGDGGRKVERENHVRALFAWKIK